MAPQNAPDSAAPSSTSGGRRGRRRPVPADARSGPSTALILIGIASVAALVLAGAALFFEMGRPSSTADTSCRKIAWGSIPTADALPAGWVMSGSGFYTDGYGASFAGPAASSASPAAGAAVTLRVSCFGADGHTALVRSRDGDLAAGGTEVQFADMGDEVAATRDANGTSTSVYIRRGPLLASIAASSSVAAADLEQAAQAVDDAMVAAQGSAGVTASDAVGPVDTAGPVGSDTGSTDAGSSDAAASGISAPTSPKPTTSPTSRPSCRRRSPGPRCPSRARRV